MGSRIKIICDDKIPFLKGVLEPFAEVQYLPPKEINHENVKSADAMLVRTRTKCNAQLLAGTNVKFIGTATIGYDHIDTKYCEANNIKWINAPGCNSFSVMQYMASALVTLSIKKNLQPDKLTLGIVGVGNVGSKIARLGKILGMNVLLNDPPRARAEGNNNFIELNDLVSSSDIVTFHVPLIKEGIDKTFHLADEKFFDKFRSKKIIINTSRGEVIKTAALKNAIEKNIVSGCIMDVWENEPDIDRELLKKVDIATPHIAGYSADGKANGTAVCVRGISSFFNFGIDADWYPSSIPDPTATREFDFKSNPNQPSACIYEAILHTYNILDDDRTLRNSTETFEKQRGNYPVRREFPYFSINPGSYERTVLENLSELGFKIISK